MYFDPCCIYSFFFTGHQGTCYFPRSLRSTATLQQLIEMMAKDNLHRVFIVDANNRPIDCISQTDVLRFCLNAMSANSIYWF